jgi:endonuclease/exonuclease/phosphatase family metal-dependent hydrolase
VAVTEVVVASWNVHSGVDGWGRPFDVVGGCRALDADVLVLLETWHPDSGPSIGRQVAEDLGYHVQERTIARATMFSAPSSPASAARDGGRWGPKISNRIPHGPRIDRPDEEGLSPAHRNPARRRRFEGRERGAIGLAVLSRFPIARVQMWELTHALGDPTRRAAISTEVVVGDAQEDGQSTLKVVGTHLSHLRHASALQVRELRRRLASNGGPPMPTLVAGDFNLPGPAVSAGFPGFRRVVRGRTWPSWRPLLQPDHLLVVPPLVAAGEVVRCPGSDHLPVRAVISLP